MPTNLDKITGDMEKTNDKESDFIKFPVGDIKIRILTDFTQTWSLYEGEYPNAKYVRMLPHYEKPTKGQTIKTSGWAWALIRGGKETSDYLKIVQFPYSLLKELGAMKSDPDWAFEEFPMEYDLTVGNTGEGGNRYSLRGSPKRTPVDNSVLTQLGEKKPCADIVKAILDKQESKNPAKAGAVAKTYEYPSEDINPNEIPF